MKYMLDLFSGLGGASEAFHQCPEWDVMRVDNNPLLSGVPNTVITDIDLLTPHQCELSIDLVWASPPCTEFSGGYSSPKSIASRTVGLENYEPNMDLLISAIELIETIKPKFWIIENVAGAIRYFREHLGEPRQIIGPYVLWGNFPMIDLDPGLIIPKKYKDTNSHDPLRSNRRAKVDFLLSQRLKDAIVNQKLMTDY
jgi:hypothetical protein